LINPEIIALKNASTAAHLAYQNACNVYRQTNHTDGCKSVKAKAARLVKNAAQQAYEEAFAAHHDAVSAAKKLKHIK
jgi:hypothetical protein